MFDDASKQRFKRQWAVYRMMADALKIIFAKRVQNAGHLAADGFDQPKFLVNVSLIVSQSCGEDVGVAAEKRWFTFGDDAFHAIGIHGLEIGNVTDDLPSRPLAADRRGVKLCLGHSCDSLSQLCWTRRVLGDQVCVYGHGILTIVSPAAL
jgi:hypothetical protein